MKKNHYLTLLCFCLLVIISGCNFLEQNNNDVESQTPLSTVVPAGNANVNIVLKTPEGQSASIRAAGSNPEVTVTLTLVNSGSETETTWTLKKTVAVSDDGKAVIEIGSIPAKPCIGEVSIANGSLNGARNFHGCVDLAPGSNTLTAVPVGMGDPEDLAVEMTRRLIATPALVKAASTDLISKVKKAVSEGDFGQPFEFEKILNQIVGLLNPADLVSIAIDSVNSAFVATKGSAQQWSVSKTILTSEDFAGKGYESLLAAKTVFRQGIGNTAYIYFEQPTTADASALVKIDSTTGSRQAVLGMRGKISHLLELADGNLIVAGFMIEYNKTGTLDSYECPFVLKWTGQANACLLNAEDQNASVKWLWLYTGQKPETADYPTRASVNKLVNFGALVMIELNKLSGGRIAETFAPTSGPVSTFNEYTAINISVNGLAVDPYLEGTQFFYDLNDNKVFDSNEPLSTPSDKNGQFTIAGPITDAHDLLAKAGALGKHLGKDFPFSLRTNTSFKDDQGRVIASPITSLVQYGVDMSQLITLINEEFAAAGITETLTVADLKADPLAGLDSINVNSLDNSDLLKIRAIIAVQQYLAVIKKLEDTAASTFNYEISLADLEKTENKQILKALAEIVKNACNVEFIRTSASTINSAIDTVATTVSQNSGGMFSISDAQKEIIRNAIQIKAIDVAKTCVSIAEYCASEMITAAKAGGKAAINEAFITALTTKTSSVMVPEIGPRYYFGRVKSVLDNPPAVTGITTPVDVDDLIWSNLRTGMQFNGAESIDGNISVNFIDSTWQGFEGIEITGDGTNFSPLK